MNFLKLLFGFLFIQKRENPVGFIFIRFIIQKNEKKMKSKAQRILKYFPEKRNEVMANLAIHFPEMVINLEEKALKKMIQMPKNNKMKHLIKQSQQSMKDEINDNKEKLVIQLKRNKI